MTIRWGATTPSASLNGSRLRRSQPLSGRENARAGGHNPVDLEPADCAVAWSSQALDNCSSGVILRSGSIPALSASSMFVGPYGRAGAIIMRRGGVIPRRARRVHERVQACYIRVSLCYISS